MTTPNAMPRKRIVEKAQVHLTADDKAFLRRVALSDKRDHPGITDQRAYKAALARVMH